MAAYNLPGDYNQIIWDFTDPVRPIPAAGGLVYATLSGTLTPATTYQDAQGLATNTYPIVADDYGQYRMWLDPALSYTIRWTLADGTMVRSEDNVVGSQAAGEGVESVNGQTGVVVLSADQIGYATSTSTTWFVGTNISAALDSVINRVDAVPAKSVSIVDAGGYFTSTNTEDALQEIGARSSHGALLRTTYFTASGTWTKGADVSFIVVEGIGGGGGSTTLSSGGGGGGAGGFTRKRITTPGSTEAVTVGNGGAPGAAGTSSAFGTWCTANGGGGATGTTAGGIGGTATGGDINLTGGGGQAGGSPTPSTAVIYGGGGNSYYGGGAPGQWSGSTGTPGAASTGGGGSGGTGGGAAGGTGQWVVWEYS